MRYLIDTNILLWFIEDNPKLPNQVFDILSDGKSEIFISILSLWEISIKYSLGKLKLPRSLDEIFSEISDEDYFHIIPVKQSHLLKQATLPFYHRDPFDRLIFAQAKIEKLKFLYTDDIFDKYEENE
mgnify:FL=1